MKAVGAAGCKPQRREAEKVVHAETRRRRGAEVGVTRTLRGVPTGSAGRVSAVRSNYKNPQRLLFFSVPPREKPNFPAFAPVGAGAKGTNTPESLAP